MNLSTLDLNRLLVLHVVLEARSVTRAAATLHVTPSAISNTLAQLRELFGDRLLVRHGRALVLTPRAVELAPLLREMAAAASRVGAAEARFDPQRSTRSFALACSDAQQVAEVPHIAAAMALELPRATLRIVSVEELEATGGLATSDVDAAIAPASTQSPDLQTSPLYREQGVLVVRRDHPRVRRKMTKDLFNELRHVDILLALGRGGIGHHLMEEVLASHGLRRDIAATTPSFSAAAAIVARTDWVTGMPQRLARRLAAQLPLRIVSLPIAPLVFEMELVWHARSHADAGSQFFRSLLMKTVRRAIQRERPKGG